jgi:photosystem II stability/assembly factor-like uncharacterized protein
MYLHILSLILLAQSFFACDQLEQTTQLTETKGNTQPKIIPSKSIPTAKNIVFQSRDFGQTWEDVSAGLPDSLSVGRVVADGREIVLASGSKLFRSSTTTKDPIWETEVLQNMEITNIFLGQTGLYVSCYEKGFFKEIPQGDLWIPMHNTLKDKTIRSVLEISDGTLFVGVESGLFKSVDSGVSWKQVINDTGINSLVAADAAGTELVCGTYEGLMHSADGGEHWTLVLTEDFGAWHSKRVAGGLVTITEGGTWKDPSRSNRMRISTNGGKTWQRMDEDLPQVPFLYQMDESGPSSRRIYAIEQAGKYLFCSTNAGIFRSDNMGKNWALMSLSIGNEMFELVVSGQILYAIHVVGC